MDLTARAWHGEGTAGTPVVILHGMFGSGENWAAIARELAAERPTYTVDLPGHGDSLACLDDDGPGTFRYGRLAAWLERALSGIPGGATAALVGHSMGGKAAMACALRGTVKPAGLVVVDSAPRSYVGNGFNQDVLAMLAAVDPSGAGSRQEVDCAMRDHIAETAMRGFMLKSLAPRPEGGFSWRFAAQALLAGAGHIADWPDGAALGAGEGARFAGPALFLRGELSDYVVEERDAVAIAALFPAARIATVPKARHWVHFDNKPDFMAELRAFLAALPG